MENGGTNMGIEGISINTPGSTGSYQNKNVTVSEAIPVKSQDNGVDVSKKDNVFSGEKNGDQRELTNDQIKKAVSDLNKKMSDGTSCQFGIHEGTGRVTIKIVDKHTKEVIKEFPAEETLEMIEKAWELAGIMVDEKL